MRHFTRFTALFLAAALFLSGCSLSSERAEENAARVSMKNDEVLARMEMQVEGGRTDGGTMD